MDTEDEEGERDEEQAPLLNHRKSKKSKTTNEQVIHKTGSLKAGFLLFKAFIGSGILFLPKAFSNGGLGFSIFFMWFMGVISLYCFLLLLECKRYLPGSYGDIGGAIYGPWMRHLVLFSIAVSQLGFVCGGTIFIVKNISAAVYSLSRETVLLPPTSVLLSVTLLLVPLVLIRNIAKLSPTALLSDVLIIAGLLIVVGYDLQTIFSSASVGFSPSTVGPDINWWFNPAECSVFIGTAVYSFEGIGLIIPIRDSMQSPEKFPKVLSFVMALVASVLCLIGALGYIAFGSDVETVVLLNLPSGTLTSSVQLSYAFAIHLSNALTIFPTVRILEQALFGERTGKNNTMVKWQKNGLRCAVVAVIAVVAKAGASDLDKFVSLIGSICCCPLSLIFPPLFHLKLNKPENSLVKLADILLIIFGIIIMFTLWSTSSRWITMG
ncbi:transmembrane amino acid transporter protein-domain-containing protein [Spinellus fusiger]|nr:transmembrane amino acid transporter protein-domain-containing protein [Spinellus fusiger]